MASYIEESYTSECSESVPLNPAPKLPRTNRRAAAVLILVTVLERCTYYTLTSNMPFTLSRWFNVDGNKKSISNCNSKGNDDQKDEKYAHMDTVSVVCLMIVFLLFSSVFSILGGWLGDSKLGRYRTLVWSFVFYILGTSVFLLLMYTMICNSFSPPALAPMDSPEYNKTKQFCNAYLALGLSRPAGGSLQTVLLIVSFILISLGYGLCKPNIAPFGADQMREGGDNILQKFYFWFYFFTNVGSLVAYSVGFLQAQSSKAIPYFGSFGVSLGCSLICFILLIANSSEFIKKEPSEDTFKTFFLILKEWILSFKTDSAVIRDTGLSRVELLKRDNGGRFGDEEVDAFVDLWRIIPMLSTMLIYWACYSQFSTFFYMQGFYLQRPEYMPLSIVELSNPPLILITVPVLLHIVYPYLARRNCSMHAFTRMQIGFALAGLSLFCAVVIAFEEKLRTQPKYNPNHTNYFHKEDGTNYTSYIVKDMSIFWLAPQIILLSFSEVFAIISSMEFVYVEAPQYMKSFAMGIYVFVNTLGDSLAIIVVLLVKYGTDHVGERFGHWICNNLNDGNLAYFFSLLMLLMVINMLCLWRHSMSKTFRPNYFNQRFRETDRF